MQSTQYPDAPGLQELIVGKDRDDVGGFATVELISPGPRGPEVRKRIKTYRVSRRVAGHNLVVNSGKRQLWRLAMGLQTKIFDQIRIGDSAQAAGSGDTNVLSPIAGSLQTVDNMTLLAGTLTLSSAAERNTPTRVAPARWWRPASSSA